MTALPLGCGRPTPPLGFQDKQGFHFTPPPGWSERDREGGVSSSYAHKAAKLPLPPLKGSERLLVRYDRVTAGQTAWLRVSVADLPVNAALTGWLSKHSPSSGWKRQAEPENLELNTLPAARVAFTGRWLDQDYLNETVAVRKDGNIYIISASFPASDTEARDAIRQAIEQATWQ